jgi:hypothetical protein
MEADRNSPAIELILDKVALHIIAPPAPETSSFRGLAQSHTRGEPASGALCPEARHPPTARVEFP